MKPLTASIDVAAPPEAVFALWADAAGWPSWDPDLEAASLEGPFEAGSRGSLKPRGGPKTSIELVRVRSPHSFTAVAHLPLCRMVFEHEVRALAEGSRVTHAVRFEGPLARAFSLLLGKGIRRGLPGTMAGLRRAVQG